MDNDKEQVSYWLTRRPAKQGPRPLPSDQDRVEKSVTGQHKITTLEKDEDWNMECAWYASAWETESIGIGNED